MSKIDLQNQLTRLVGRVREMIDRIGPEHPLRRWFQLELRTLDPAGHDSMSMEEMSARMRAVRQLQFMVLENASPKQRAFNAEESEYTQMARFPGALLETVRQTNFSIEPELLHGEATAAGLFDLVSPTAKVVSHLRDRDGSLGFAQTLTCPREAREILRQLEIDDDRVQASMATLFRARYHTINAVIRSCGVTQVLEIASGISPRGLHWSRENPGTVYVESDLPALMRKKAKALRDAIQHDTVARRGVLHCCGIDALELAGLQHALEYTDPEADLVIVTEGLLLYFNHQEMQTFFQHMRHVLTERPRASWVVDLVSRRNLQELFDSDPQVAAAVKKVFASTSRDVVQANPFVDDTAVGEALKSNGLDVHSQHPLAKSVEPNQSPAICGTRQIWKIRAG